MTTKKLELLFGDYEASHRKLGNKLTHVVGIPTIAFALFGLGSKVPLLALGTAASLDLGQLLGLALVLAYLRWHAGLAIGAGLLFVPLYLAGSRLPALWLWLILGAAVGLQYVGHFVFEKNQPAFHRNVIHTLVGPLWIASLLLRHLGFYHPRRTVGRPKAGTQPVGGAQWDDRSH